MDWNRFEAQWGQYQAKVKQHFDKLTDDDLTFVEGKEDELVGRIQKISAASATNW